MKTRKRIVIFPITSKKSFKLMLVGETDDTILEDRITWCSALRHLLIVIWCYKFKNKTTHFYTK